jgi:hypothetical protein
MLAAELNDFLRLTDKVRTGVKGRSVRGQDGIRRGSGGVQLSDMLAAELTDFLWLTDKVRTGVKGRSVRCQDGIRRGSGGVQLSDMLAAELTDFLWLTDKVKTWGQRGVCKGSKGGQEGVRRTYYYHYHPHHQYSIRDTYLI